jgi:hypothetical protein
VPGRRQVARCGRDGGWRSAYEELRAAALAGEVPDSDDARRLARFGLAGLAARRPAWAVVVSQGPEPRWTGSDPRLASLVSAYRLVTGESA